MGLGAGDEHGTFRAAVGAAEDRRVPIVYPEPLAGGGEQLERMVGRCSDAQRAAVGDRQVHGLLLLDKEADVTMLPK